MGFHLHEHKKKDGRRLWLYSQEPRDYVVTNDIEPDADKSNPIARWHPLREEFVYYNPTRNTRTLNPPPDYNPLAPVPVDGFPGEIPVTDFEVAIFENRWPSLTDPSLEKMATTHAYGRCEVVVYATQDHGSLADRSVDEVALLLRAIADRHARISQDDAIQHVIPFENRGAFVGTTLPHPHGQIYAFRELSPMIERQKMAALNGGFRALDQGNLVAEAQDVVTFCPTFARYPFETWIMSKKDHPSPDAMAKDTLFQFAAALRDQVARFDHLFSEPMPFVMWHSFAPKGAEEFWPYHIEFWPLQRGEGKRKFLASVEQITGSFLVDVMPEEASKILRETALSKRPLHK